MIGIFNRSHYEDVLIARVHGLADLKVIERRYDQINEFEKELVKSGTKVVKFCLHISYDEQRRRLIERLDDPDKHWKFHENDINERAFWDDYQSAYGIAITKCSTQWAPWYVIPADDKDYRNWAVSQDPHRGPRRHGSAVPQAQARHPAPEEAPRRLSRPDSARLAPTVRVATRASERLAPNVRLDKKRPRAQRPGA